MAAPVAPQSPSPSLSTPSFCNVHQNVREKLIWKWTKRNWREANVIFNLDDKRVKHTAIIYRSLQAGTNNEKAKACAEAGCTTNQGRLRGPVQRKFSTCRQRDQWGMEKKETSEYKWLGMRYQLWWQYPVDLQLVFKSCTNSKENEYSRNEK